MSLADPPVFRLAQTEPGRLTLAAEGGAVVHIFVLEDDIVRVLVLPDGAVRQPKTWAIAPGAEDVAADGRDRFDLVGFTLPAFGPHWTGTTAATEQALEAVPEIKIWLYGPPASKLATTAARSVAAPGPVDDHQVDDLAAAGFV